MAHRAVFVHNEPILDAQLAIKLVAVVTLLCISAHFEAYLTQEVICKGFVDLKYGNRICVVADINFIMSLSVAPGRHPIHISIVVDLTDQLSSRVRP